MLPRLRQPHDTLRPVTHYDWSSAPREALSEKLTRQVFHTELMTIARLEVKKGGVVPVHWHENEQVSMVLEGRLKFLLNDGDVIVGPGQTLVLPSMAPHGVEVLEDTVVVDVFTPRREDWLRGEDAYLRK